MVGRLFAFRGVWVTVYVVVSQQTDEPHAFRGVYATLDGAKASLPKVGAWYETTASSRRYDPYCVAEGTLPYADGGDSVSIYEAEVEG